MRFQPLDADRAKPLTGGQRSLRLSPLRCLVVLSVCLFLVEFAVMFLMPYLPPLRPWVHNLTDATLMLLLSFPALYYLVLRPLHLHIRERERVEETLREHRDRLEDIVAQRTAELRHARDGLELRVEERTRDLQVAVSELRTEVQVRERTQRALAESEHRYHRLFEAAPAGIALTDLSGRILEVNPALCHMFGYSTEELKAQTALAFYQDPADRERLLEQIRLSGRVDEHELRLRKKDGSEFFGLAQMEEVALDHQKFLFTILRDITERKRLEKLVLEITEKERQRVGRDLHDSLGGKLTGAALLGKALSKTLAAKGLAEQRMAEEVIGYVNEAVIEARAIARGLCPLEPGELGLASGLQEFAGDVRKRFGIQCDVQAARDVAIQDGFMATHLLRIVQEAVHNAIRHGQARKVEIDLTKSGPRLVLEIRDNGAGLPADLDASRGLGLRTMKYRAGVMGGDLEVKPGERGGTVVACRVPVQSPLSS